MLVHNSGPGWSRPHDHLFINEKHACRRQERILQVMTAEEYYRLGNRYRKEGNWQEALNNYIAAIELDPESPAVEAKKMLDDILNYYCKDMYNP